MQQTNGSSCEESRPKPLIQRQSSIVIRCWLGKPMGDQWEQLRREPTQAFDPATIKHEGEAAEALCDAMRKAKLSTCAPQHSGA